MNDDQPKPTGEWTADYVWNLRNNELEADRAIADAHNSALAAEREAKDRLLTEVADMTEQFTTERVWRKGKAELAAERERVQTLAFALQMLHDDIAEYAAINHLGGFQNHVMKEARAALAKVKEGK